MEESVYSNWSNVVEEICNESLAYSLIVRNPTTLLIKTNFSPKVTPSFHLIFHNLIFPSNIVNISDVIFQAIIFVIFQDL